MKETFTEEEYQEISKLYSSEVLKNHYGNKDNYLEYDGYTNLKDLELLPEEFELLWKLQELLNTYDLYKTQLSKNMYDTLENIKTLYLNLFKEEI